MELYINKWGGIKSVKDMVKETGFKAGYIYNVGHRLGKRLSLGATTQDDLNSSQQYRERQRNGVKLDPNWRANRTPSIIKRKKIAYITENIEKLSIEEMSSHLNCSDSNVRNLILKNNLRKNPVVKKKIKKTGVKKTPEFFVNFNEVESLAYCRRWK